MSPRRVASAVNVVSTSPSATEILYALGVEPVAVSHACDYPPAVADAPRIDASRVDGETSGERHARAETASADGHVYDVHTRRLREAAPDLIVTQEVCGVCAVDATVIDDVLADLDADPEVLGLNANRLDDVFDCIRAVGRATGREERAATLVAELRGRLDAIATRAAVADPRPRVAVIEWMDPVHVAANWVPELVELAGGDYGLAAAGRRSTETAWADVVDYAPEVLVVAPCSYPVERTRDRRAELADRAGWERLPAVRTGRVFAFDGSSYLTRWSPRLVDAAERLAAALHPDVFGPPPADVFRLVEPTTA